MPVIKNDSYTPPFFLRGKHSQTIFPALFRKIKGLPSPQEKTLHLSDGDELFYDHYAMGNQKAVIISHGLEGNSKRPYILGLTKICIANGYDVIAWNFRSCGGKMNKVLRFYHSGATDDLDSIVEMVAKDYSVIHLAGFSLGANLILKFTGEGLADKYPSISKVAALCAPVDLKGGSITINKKSNTIYAKRFLKKLTVKIIEKAKLMPDQLDVSHLENVHTLFDFDNYYTSQLHGFLDANDYYEQCSAIKYIHQIKKETLVLNAINDPLLPRETLHEEEFISIKNVTLELTNNGGHCGYPTFSNDGYYWSEKRIIQFFND